MRTTIGATAGSPRLHGLAAAPLFCSRSDTVIVVGRDGDAWWSHTQDPVDATARLLAAFTRAKQRVIFTYPSEHGQRATVAPLYELLDRGGVPRVAVA